MERLIDIVLFIIFFPPKKKLRHDIYRKKMWTIVSDISKDVLGPPPALEL
jgi:hypothetical protein